MVLASSSSAMASGNAVSGATVPLSGAPSRSTRGRLPWLVCWPTAFITSSRIQSVALTPSCLTGFATADANRGGHFIRAVGRLKEGVSVDQARAELTAIAARLERDHPQDNTNQGIHVTSLHDALVAEARPALLLLGAAVLFVLLVACANLANLLLAQGASRRTELAVRASMGAGRGRLIRQLITESVVLSLLGAVAGLVLTVISTRALTMLGAAGVPRADDIGVDWAVLLYAVALAIATGVVAGILPAIQAVGGDLHSMVREGSRGQSRAALQHPAREFLIVSQIALALVLLAAAGLMIRSLWQLTNVKTGFVAERVLTFETAVPTATYAEGQQIPFYESLSNVIRSQPGVQAVGAINILPLQRQLRQPRGANRLCILNPLARHIPSRRAPINPDYFAAMGIPLIRGRTFTEKDREGQPRVVIVSESMRRGATGRAWMRSVSASRSTTAAFRASNSRRWVVLDLAKWSASWVMSNTWRLRKRTCRCSIRPRRSSRRITRWRSWFAASPIRPA